MKFKQETVIHSENYTIVKTKRKRHYGPNSEMTFQWTDNGQWMHAGWAHTDFQ